LPNAEETKLQTGGNESERSEGRRQMEMDKHHHQPQRPHKKNEEGGSSRFHWLFIITILAIFLGSSFTGISK
jgi:hypothetical protein